MKYYIKQLLHDTLAPIAKSIVDLTRAFENNLHHLSVSNHNI